MFQLVVEGDRASASMYRNEQIVKVPSEPLSARRQARNLGTTTIDVMVWLTSR